MDKNFDIDNLTPDDYENFFESVGNVAADYRIAKDGFQYVDDAQFWDWFTSEIVKKHNSADDIKNWINGIESLKNEKSIQSINSLIQGRGAEWDYINNFNNNPLNIGKRAELGTLADDNNGVDVFIRKLFGEDESVQIKAGLSDTYARQDFTKYKNQGVDKVAVNERIKNWRENNPNLVKDNIKIEKAFSDEELTKATKRRLNQAREGKANPGVNLQGTLKQAGKGALIGAAISVSISTLQNYGLYKNGEITQEEFVNTLINDTAHGTVTGGAMGAISIPIKLAATNLGVGAPVTIPVMIIVGAGLQKIIKPMFGKGEYKEILTKMNYTTNLTRGFAHFAYLSVVTFEIQKQFINEMIKHEKQRNNLNEISKTTNQMISDALRCLSRKLSYLVKNFFEYYSCRSSFKNSVA